MTRRHSSDSRLAAARYAADRTAPPAERSDDDQVDPGRPTPDQRAQAVEVAIQQAMRRGDFDDLPGTGRPLPDLGAVRDPDWWIRRKIEHERLTGLGPPALTLRTEDAELADRLDEIALEARVREVLEDFNRRVREARRQLLGGPPVITRPRRGGRGRGMAEARGRASSRSGTRTGEGARARGRSPGRDDVAGAVARQTATMTGIRVLGT